MELLPFDMINSMRPSQFKIKLAEHFWNIALVDNEQPEDQWSFQSSDKEYQVFKFKGLTPKCTSCRTNWTFNV